MSKAQGTSQRRKQKDDRSQKTFCKIAISIYDREDVDGEVGMVLDLFKGYI